MHKKRSQMEIMGLAVIIIIVIFVGLLYFRLSSKPQTLENVDINYRSQTFNLVNAMLNTNLPNRTDTMEDLIEVCHEDPFSTRYGDPPCELLENEIFNIMNQTLLPAQSFNIQMSNDRALIANRTCPAYSRRYTVNFTSHDVQIQFSICRPQTI